MTKRILLTTGVVLLCLSFLPALSLALSLEIVPTTKKIYQSSTVKNNDKPNIELWAARNEYESAQIAMRSESTVIIDKIECTGLLNAKNGARIPRKHFRLRTARYVYISKNTPLTPPTELDATAPGWFPDPLDENAVPVSLNNAQSVFVTWYIPPGTSPGDYSGELTIKAGSEIRRIPVLVHVWNLTLPARPTFYVTNWLHKSQIEAQYKVKQGSPEFWRIIESVAADMISHRQNVIFTPLNLIRSLRRDGKYSFDFGDYEKWVRIFLKKGFVAIEGSHLFHPGNSYSVYEQKNGSLVATRIEKEVLSTTEGKAFLHALLKALHKENVKLGISDKYIQHVADEPKPADLPLYEEIAGIVRRSMPGVPIMDAIELPAEKLKGMADIPVTLLGKPVGRIQPEFVKWGKWWYTAVVPRGRFPNRFIDYPLVKMRVIPWISACNNMSGYLHYAYNWWFTPSGKSPWIDTQQSGTYPPGDGFIVYPPSDRNRTSPVSSLRWEVFRDGLEDYEYIILLRKWVERASINTAADKALLNEANAILSETCSAMRSTENYPRDISTIMGNRHRIGSFLEKATK